MIPSCVFQTFFFIYMVNNLKLLFLKKMKLDLWDQALNPNRHGVLCRRGISWGQKKNGGIQF
jgi:hypothetical protein